MARLEHYLTDGACWQAQCVLAYLRSHHEEIVDGSWNTDTRSYSAYITVGRFENCREQGYIFSLRFEGRQRNYCVYEHRNIDNICIVVFDEQTINTPSLNVVCDKMGGNKYNTTQDFSNEEVIECAKYIAEDMKSFING